MHLEKKSTEVADGGPSPFLSRVQALRLSDSAPPPAVDSAGSAQGEDHLPCGRDGMRVAQHPPSFLFGLRQPAGYTHFPLLQAISFKGSDTHGGGASSCAAVTRWVILFNSGMEHKQAHELYILL